MVIENKSHLSEIGGIIDEMNLFSLGNYRVDCFHLIFCEI